MSVGETTGEATGDGTTADVPVTPASHLDEVRRGYTLLGAHDPDRISTDPAAKPWDRAVLGVFADLVRADGPDRPGPVADVGCGLGRLTAHLHSLGLDVYGVDVTPALVERASREHPHLRFVEGSMLDLDVPDGSLAGVLAFYAIIHLLPEQLPAALVEFHRALRPGGHVLLAFQVGDEVRVHRDVGGERIELGFRRWQPAVVEEELGRAGFSVQASVLREPDDTETVHQAFILACRSR